MRNPPLGKTQILTKNAPKKERHLPPSPHLLDLKIPAPPAAPEKPMSLIPRGPLARFLHILDERIHLHDLRRRTVSIRHYGWKDFPPHSALTMWQALRTTTVRFFAEHPLADLTILTAFHILAVIFWKVFVHPFFVLARLVRTRTSVTPMRRVLPMMPFAAAPLRTRPLKKSWALPRIALPRISFAFLQLQHLKKHALGFAGAAMLFILPFGAYATIGGLRTEKAHVIDRSMHAVSLLKAAGEAVMVHDFQSADDNFSEAAKNFTNAREELGALGTILNSTAEVLPVNTSFTSAGPLLTAGEAIAKSGEKISVSMTALASAKDPIEKLRLLRTTLAAALPHLKIATHAIGKVADNAVPEEYRSYIALAKEALPKLTDTVTNAVSVAGTLEAILGNDGPKRYLVVFQNNAELRPTGGFIGSFALVDIDGGRVKMEIPGGGSYDIKGQLALTLNSPQPLHLINPRWQFQDANWYPDFPTSAETLSRFYEKSGGPTVDGVIAVTATFMEKLLAVTGPIDMPEYNKTIGAQNFFYETQKEVELDYDKTENKPKKFIADLAPKVLERVMSADEKMFIRLATVLDGALGEKELLFWSKNTETQQQVAARGWDGSIKSAVSDYLYIVHTNIAGQKTDLAMKDVVNHSAKILPDGGVIVTLSLARTHTGLKGALFSGVRNVDFMRAYVPKGSVLVSASGFTPPDPKLFKLAEQGLDDDAMLASQQSSARIDRDSGTIAYEENDKTVFGNWIQTDPGETSEVTLVYQLPPGTAELTTSSDDGRLAALYGRLTNAADKRLHYSLLVQKQPGATPPTVISSVDLPRGYYATWQSPTRKEDERGRLATTAILTRDADFGIVAESQ